VYKFIVMDDFKFQGGTVVRFWTVERGVRGFWSGEGGNCGQQVSNLGLGSYYISPRVQVVASHTTTTRGVKWMDVVSPSSIFPFSLAG